MKRRAEKKADKEYSMEFLVVSDIHCDEYAKFAGHSMDGGMNSRLFWTVDVFDQIREYGQEKGIKRLLIGGDIFDKRGVISTPVYDAVYKKLHELKATGWDILSIVGNHDQAIRSGAIHALRPLPVLVVDSHDTVVVDYDLTVGGVSFCESSKDFLLRLEEVAKSKPDCYLIHQGVNGAKWAGDEILSRDETDLADIRRIVGPDALVMSGHYHIHQFLDPRFLYIGSAVPRDFSDRTPKGFLHYKQGTFTQIESRAPKFVSLDEGELSTRADEIKGNYVQVFFEKEEPKEVAKLSPAGWVGTRKKTDRVYTPRSSINPEHSPMVIIRNYVSDLKKEDKLPKGIDEGELLLALKDIVGVRTLESSFAGHRVEVICLAVQNFMSYKSGMLDFENYEGLTLIEGENVDDPSATSNGSGKSLIPEAIKWALFGSTARGVSGDEVVRRGAEKKGAEVDLLVKVGEYAYRITRYRKHPEHKNQLFFFRVSEDGDESDDLRGATDADTQTRLEKELGINERTFDNTVFFGHGFTSSFAAATDKEQKSVIETILGVEYFSELHEKARDLAKEKLEIHRQAEVKYAYDSQRVQEEARNWEDIQRAFEDYEYSRKTLIDEMNAQLLEKLDYAETIHDTGEEEVQLAALEDEIEDLEKKVAGLAEAEESLENWRDLERDAKNKIYKINVDIKSWNEDIKSDEKRLASADEDLKKHDASAVDSKCPLCSQPLKSRGAVENKRVELKDNIASLKVRISNRGDLIRKAREDLLALESDLKKSEAGIKKAEAIVKKAEPLTAKLQEHRLSRQRLAQSIENIKGASAQAVQEVERLTFAIESKTAEKNPQQVHLERVGGILKGLERAMVDSRKQMAEALEAFEKLKFWENAFSDKGTPSQSPIKSYLFDAVVPVLDELARIYSEILTSGSMQVHFNTVTALKSGEFRDKFSVTVLNKHGAGAYLGDSGGERRKVDLAIMFALYSLAKMRSGSYVDVLFLDEILDSLDAEGCERVMVLLKEMEKEVKSIFVITHNEVLKTKFANILRVKKENGVSQFLC